MADVRLSVLLSHLAPEQKPLSQWGSQIEVPWSFTNNGPLVIVGGICLDIQAQPSGVDVQRGTSVPGQVRQMPGGVGRNMAEALSGLLPADKPAPVFVSLVGDDTAGSFLMASLRRLRLDLSHLMTCPGAPTPCVSAVLERGGEVAACVADVATVEDHLTPGRLGECRGQIHQASLVLAEGNLSADALEFVSRTAAQARVPVFLEPVSVPKAARLARSLPYATFVSPNAAELISIANEVNRAAGLPLLPRPSLPEGPGQEQGDAASSSAPLERTNVLLRELAAFAEVVLMQGTSCVVLTLGSLGAALVTLCDTAAVEGPDPARGSAHVQAQPQAGLASSSTCGACQRDMSTRIASTRCGSQNCANCCGREEIATSSGRVGAPCGGSDSMGAAGSGVGQCQPTRLLARATTAAGTRSAGQRHAGVQVLHLRALPVEVVNVNGAGDTLVAGMVAALLRQQEPVRALAYGMAAAKRAVGSRSNVPDLDFATLRPDADTVAATLRRHFFPSARMPAHGAVAPQ